VEEESVEAGEQSQKIRSTDHRISEASDESAHGRIGDPKSEERPQPDKWVN